MSVSRRDISRSQRWLESLPPRMLIALLAEVGSPYGGVYSRIAARLIRGELRSREFGLVARASSATVSGA